MFPWWQLVSPCCLRHQCWMLCCVISRRDAICNLGVNSNASCDCDCKLASKNSDSIPKMLPILMVRRKQGVSCDPIRIPTKS